MSYISRKHAKNGRRGPTKKTEKIVLYAQQHGINAAAKQFQHLYKSKNCAYVVIFNLMKKWNTSVNADSNTRNTDVKETKAKILQLVKNDTLAVNEALDLLEKVA